MDRGSGVSRRARRARRARRGGMRSKCDSSLLNYSLTKADRYKISTSFKSRYYSNLLSDTNSLMRELPPAQGNSADIINFNNADLSSVPLS